MSDQEAVQSVGIEASDINDGDVISGTRQMGGPNGTVIFQYTLPTGRVISAEPVQSDLVSKAIFPWIEFVKQTIVEEGRVANDAALKAQRDKDWATPGIQPVAGATVDDVRRLVGGHIPGEEPVPEPLPSDAKAYVRAKLNEAKRAVKMLKESIKSRQTALKAQEKAVRDWTATVKALAGSPQKKGGKKR